MEEPHVPVHEPAVLLLDREGDEPRSLEVPLAQSLSVRRVIPSPVLSDMISKLRNGFRIKELEQVVAKEGSGASVLVEEVPLAVLFTGAQFTCDARRDEPQKETHRGELHFEFILIAVSQSCNSIQCCYFV